MHDVLKVANKHILRGRVLRIAEAAAPIGAGTDLIADTLSKHDIKTTREEINACCNYLQDKGLIKMQIVSNEVLKIRRDIAHITSLGIDVLEGTTEVEGIRLDWL